MPAEDPTTQVAPASDPADVGAVQAEQAPPPQEQAAGANGETPPEPDVKAEWEKTKAELAQERSLRQTAEKDRDDAKNLVRTQAGTQSASDRGMNDLRREVKRLGEVVRTGLTTPDKVADLETTHRNEDEESFASFTAEQGRNNAAALRAAGFTDADTSDDELADGLLIWESAVKLGDRAGIERAVKSLGRGIKRMQAAKEAKKPAAAPAPEPKLAVAESNGTGRRVANLDTGVGAGVANISMPTLVERYGADYESLSPDQRKRAEDYMRREGLI